MKRGLIGVSLAGLALLALGAIVLMEAGAWLVVEDPLQPAPVAIVFGGKVPFRAMEAARIYRQGAAREVWLTQGGLFLEDAELEKLGIERTPEHMYSRMVLERMGVPPAAIRLLPGNNENTAREIQTIARELDRAGLDRAILVTSSYHTRRVRLLWRQIVGDRRQAIVRSAPDDPFQPHGWWRDAGDVMAVTREWFGLVNAWTGFPISSQHW